MGVEPLPNIRDGILAIRLFFNTLIKAGSSTMGPRDVLFVRV
jgi:hypothetical protein